MTPATTAPAPFGWPVRVYWEDTDAGGVVFHANYLRYFERARTEWLRAFGLDQRDLVAQTGGMFIVAAAQLRYRAPARLDDALTVTVEPERFAQASVMLRQCVWRGEALLTEGHMRLGFVDARTLRPRPLPDIEPFGRAARTRALARAPHAPSTPFSVPENPV